MAIKKPTWPSTFLPDLSPREAGKLRDVVKYQTPEHVPVSKWWVLFWIAAFLGAFRIACVIFLN